MHIGKHASAQLANVLNSLDCQRPLIVTDQVMRKIGYVDQLQVVLAEAGIDSDVYADTVPEPTVASILGGVEMAVQGDYDCLVAIGGGSPIDSAKAIGILAKLGGEMSDYKVPRIVDEQGLPVIAIPTTAGTGSEATRATVITNELNDEKMLCMGKGFVPVAALVDYQLTLTVPPRTAADTAIDSLTHAIEAYVSRKASPFTDAQATQAMGLIAPNLRAVYTDPSNLEAKEQMMLGATLAGIAFSNASVALVHGMSRPIGAFFHVPHGLSNAMLLPAVTRFSIVGNERRYAHCARAMKIANAQDSDQQANQKLLIELDAINSDLEVPNLAEFGVSRQHFDKVVETMVEQALSSGSPANNPRIPHAGEIFEIYQQLWS